MKLNILPRASVAVLAVALLAPFARADTQADAILKKIELRGKKINTFSATITRTYPIDPDRADKIQIKLRRYPIRALYFRAHQSGFVNDTSLAIVLNGQGTFIKRRDRWEKSDAIFADLPELWPGIWITVAESVGGIKSTRYMSLETHGNDKHFVDIVEVVGKKTTARLTVNVEGIIEEIRTTLPTGGVSEARLSNLQVNKPIPESTFAIPASTTN